MYPRQPTVADIEAACDLLRLEAEKAIALGAMERYESLRAVWDALAALLPKNQPVDVSRIKPQYFTT